MQLHRLIGTNAPCTARGGDVRHRTRSSTPVPKPRAQSTMEELRRRSAGTAAETHDESRLGGLARTLGAGARWKISDATSLSLKGTREKREGEEAPSGALTLRASIRF